MGYMAITSLVACATCAAAVLPSIVIFFRFIETPSQNILLFIQYKVLQYVLSQNAM
jgi:hypothetical protein